MKRPALLYTILNPRLHNSPPIHLPLTQDSRILLESANMTPVYSKSQSIQHSQLFDTGEEIIPLLVEYHTAIDNSIVPPPVLDEGIDDESLECTGGGCVLEYPIDYLMCSQHGPVNTSLTVSDMLTFGVILHDFPSPL
jgi:hypothetical protein